MTYHLSLAGVPCLSSPRCASGTLQHIRNAQFRPRIVRATKQPCGSVRQAVHASSQEASPQAATEQSQISVELMKQMESSITEALHAEKVVVQDVYGDGRHVSIEVVSAEFEGQSSVKRQRLVYKVHLPSFKCHLCFAIQQCFSRSVQLLRFLLNWVSSVDTKDATTCACRQSGKSYKTQYML